MLREGDLFDIEDLPLEISDSSLPPSNIRVEIQEDGISLEDIVVEYIRTALRQSRGNQTKAAELLGISRRQLQNRMQNHGLNSQDFKNKNAS